MKGRIDSLQAVRAIACILAFMHHCYITDFGVQGVAIFFMLSGFLMCRSYYDRSLPRTPIDCLRFSARKIWKLYPLHILTMLPVLALDIYTMKTAPQPGAAALIAEKLAASVLLVQSWSPRLASAFNGVAWYLSVSLFLYFAFPFILRAIRRYRSRGAACAAIAALFALDIALGLIAAPLCTALRGGYDAGFVSWLCYMFPPTRCIDFAIGCNLGYLFITRGEKPVSRGQAAALEGACVLLFAGAWLIFRRISGTPAAAAFGNTQLCVLPAAALVYLFALDPGVLTRLLTNRATIFLGGISASFFLIHQDVIRITYMLLDRLGLTLEQSKPILFFACGAASVALSVIYERLEAAVKRRIHGRALNNA